MREWGIICGCDRTQEWLLPWWWERYTAKNHFPVSFADFGMSSTARSWCQERGQMIDIDFDPRWICSKDQIEPHRAQEWEAIYGESVWDARAEWFKKPFALLQAPYKHCVWIDLDCEILGVLEPLFGICTQDAPLALSHEHRTDHYNGGVIAFVQGAPVLSLWAEAVKTHNHLFWGDDRILSFLIAEHKIEVIELSAIYNWRIVRGVNVHAVIHHWTGSGGKAYIKKCGGLLPIIQAFARK